MGVTLYHRLVLPAEANHHGTLYAGSLLRLALEAGYATAWKEDWMTRSSLSSSGWRSAMIRPLRNT